MTDEWDGVERRVDDARFTKAMADVRELKTATAGLTEAVKMKTETLHTILVRIGYMMVALVVINILLSLIFVNNLNNHNDAGHARITCLQTLTAEQRAALGELACK